MLERAVGEAPADTRLAEMLGRWRREAELHDRMQQSLNERFTVSFEGPEEATLAAQALESLDRAYWRIGEALSTYPNRPISVVLYTGEQFHDITRSPAWAAGAYDGTIRVPMRGALDNAEGAGSRAGSRVRPRARQHAGAAERADLAERRARDGARSRFARLGAGPCRTRRRTDVARPRCGRRSDA